MSNGQLPNTVVPIHLYKVFISADAYLGKEARCTARAGLCRTLLSSSGGFIVTLSASFRTQWIIQRHFITPPVLFCLLEYHPMVQHPSGFRHKTCRKCSSSQGLEGIFSLMLEPYRLTVPLIFCLREKVNWLEKLSMNKWIRTSCLLYRLWQSSVLSSNYFEMKTKHTGIWEGLPKSSSGCSVPLTHLG